MSKEEENKEEIVENPFSGFNLLDSPKINNSIEDDSKDKIIFKEEIEEEKEKESTEEELKLKAADEALAKVIAKQAKALDKKKGIIVEEEVEDHIEEDQIDDSDSLKPFLTHMGEKGLLHFDESEFKDEDFKDEEILDKVVAKTVAKGIQEWKESYHEDVKAFLEFTEQGGSPKDFINTWYGEQSWNDFKIETEVTQKTVIREALRLENYSTEEIEDELTLIEDSGKLESKSKMHLSRLQKNEEISKKQLIERQKQTQIQQEEANKKYYEDLQKHWFNKEEINGFKLTKGLKDKVWDTIYKIDRKTGKTALQESYDNNIDAQFMYALLVANNYDMSKFERQVQNKVTSKIRKSLSNYTDQRNKIGGGSRTEKEEKIDASNNSFDGFRKIA